MPKVVVMMIGVLLFALVTALIYGWGVIKAHNQPRDLYRLMLGKGVDRVNKHLKSHEYITGQEMQELVKDIKVSQFYSRNRLAVTDKKEFAEGLASFMKEQHLLKEDRENGKVIYKKYMS